MVKFIALLENNIIIKITSTYISSREVCRHSSTSRALTWPFFASLASCSSTLSSSAQSSPTCAKTATAFSWPKVDPLHLCCRIYLEQPCNPISADCSRMCRWCPARAIDLWLLLTAQGAWALICLLYPLDYCFRAWYSFSLSFAWYFRLFCRFWSTRWLSCTSLGASRCPPTSGTLAASASGKEWCWRWSRAWTWGCSSRSALSRPSGNWYLCCAGGEKEWWL